MPRNGRDLFDRSVFTRTTAADILSGRATARLATSRRPKPVADKPKPKPKAEPESDVDRLIANEKFDGLTAERAENAREIMRRMARGDLDTQDPEKWANSTPQSTAEDASEAFAAYIRMRDAGLLPPAKGGSTSEILADRQKTEAFGKALLDKLGDRQAEREYKIEIDEQGRVIGVFRGDKGAVGGYPSLSDERQGNGYPALQHAVAITTTAGGMQAHNHPYGEKSEDGRKLGLPLSNGDLGSMVQRAQAGGMAVAKEGVYVMRNPKWREDADKVRTALAQATARADSLGLAGKARSAMIAAEVTPVVKGVMSRGKEVYDRIEAASRGAQKAMFGIGLGRGRGRLGEMNEKQNALLSRAIHQAVKSVARMEGLEVDFIPNRGYESINERLPTDVNDFIGLVNEANKD